MALCMHAWLPRPPSVHSGAGMGCSRRSVEGHSGLQGRGQQMTCCCVLPVALHPYRPRARSWWTFGLPGAALASW